jgi:hypothetical protein
MTIKDYCLQISKLLEGTNNSDKSDTFIWFANHYDFDKSDVISKIKSIYGGMGSFSDMVLYKNGKVDLEGNERLSILREGLYNAVASEIIKMRS